MTLGKILTRIFIWLFVLLCILTFCFLYFFGDINKLKGAVEKNLKNELSCTVKLGDLNWDWDGLKLGVTTQTISVFDKENNLVLQGGPTRFVWHLKNIISGSYSHFYSIASTNLYLNAIRYKDSIWNLVRMFPPGPPPKVDNLELHNSIIYLVDEFSSIPKTSLYKDLNIVWTKKDFSQIRKIDFVSRVGSASSSSFIRVNGSYSERKKFDWKKSVVSLYVVAKRINLSDFQSYFTSVIKNPKVTKISGNFTGVLYVHKTRGEKFLKVKSKTNTDKFSVEVQNNEITQLIEIPKTDFLLRANIHKDKINLRAFKSHIDELVYELKGDIYNWSGQLPEVNLFLKTNKFNFKAVKPYLPLSLLPASTRSRIEPINDEGFVELNVNLKGPLIAPKYFGTILLSDFNLTGESGFLNVIHGLEGKLFLDDEILKIDHLSIPIEGSPLVLKGEINNNGTTRFNINGKNLTVRIIQDLLSELVTTSPFLKEISTNGDIDLNFDVEIERNFPPEIRGRLIFHNAGLSVLNGEELNVKNVFGELILDGSKVTFNKVLGLINGEGFFVEGNFSLKEDEKVNLILQAKKLTIVPYILSFIVSKTPFKPVAKTISGEASDLNLTINGELSKPSLNGMLILHDISFNLPNLAPKISNISGSLRFEGSELVVDDLEGKIQDSAFSLAGYIEDLFNKPKPKLRLITEDLDISTFWNYLKEVLKTTSVHTQTNEVEKLKGQASLDIFLHPDIVLGNIYFKDTELKYKPFPFSLNNLTGRLVIGEKNISLFNLTGQVGNSNNFNCDLIVYNYQTPDFNIQGQLNLELNLPSFLKASNISGLNTFKISGLIPTVVNFDAREDNASLNIYSTLDEMLELVIPPYITKPIGKTYLVSGGLDFDNKFMDLYLSNLNISTNMLSLQTTGSIKNISSKSPELMLFWRTYEPSGLFMITEPITQLMDYKIYGTVELTGSVNGTPQNYSVSTNALISDLMMPDLFGKKLTASNGIIGLYIDPKQGFLNSTLNNINYTSLAAMSVSLTANYLNPVVYLSSFSLDANPGTIYAAGSYNPKDNAIIFSAAGSGIELAGLGSFIFLDPTKISGITDFLINVDAKGKTKEEIISSAKGILSFSVNDGKLGQVALLQKGIKLANIFKQGVFGLNLSNVFSLFFKYQDGSFNSIKGDFALKNGVVKAKAFNYRAKDLFLNSFGFIDLLNSFVNLAFYGHLPQKKGGERGKEGELKDGKEILSKTFQVSTPIESVISIIPDVFGKKRFFIPFLASSLPEYFKFEIKGDIKNQKKITSHARRSFKWLRGNRLKKEFKYVPKEES